jgi:hypothetical protein
MHKPSANLTAAILASVVGGTLTGLAFSKFHHSGLLDLAVIPGTIVYLIISGGEAGSSPFAEAIAPPIAVIVNMVCYSAVVLAASQVFRRLQKENP